MPSQNANTESVENPPETAKKGFAGVAVWLAFDVDGEALIFRKFDELSVRNLLFLQTEILVIKRELEGLDKDAAKYDAKMDVQDAARTWEALIMQCKGNQSDPASKYAARYLKLMEDLRKKLKEYHKALLLQAQIINLPRPGDRALTATRNWFNGGNKLRPDGTKPLPALGGAAKDLFDDLNDLVALKSHEDMDMLSRFVRDHWKTTEEEARDNTHSIGRYSEISVSLTVGLITVAFAAILLLGPITGLYFVTSPVSQLLMIYAFMAAFAISLGIMTNAKRVEIFGATAAYAAVLVVFVSNGSLSGNQKS